VAKGLADRLPADLVAIDLRDALHHLGTITGQVTSDEVLGSIFSRFCIGK
jgi:tRNA modification GTPase